MLRSFFKVLLHLNILIGIKSQFTCTEEGPCYIPGVNITGVPVQPVFPPQGINSAIQPLPSYCDSTWDFSTKYVDWTTGSKNPCGLDFVSPPRQQESGDCYAFAFAAMLETKIAILSKSTFNDVQVNLAAGITKANLMSVQQVIECSYHVKTFETGGLQNSGFNGGNAGVIAYTYEGTTIYSTSISICTEDEYPYRPLPPTQPPVQGCRVICNSSKSTQYMVTKFSQFNLSPYSNIKAVLQRGPVVIGGVFSQTAFVDANKGIVPTSSSFMTPLCGYSLFGQTALKHDHDMLIVGYGNFVASDPTNLYWKIKNSWGNSEGTGDNGYWYLKMDINTPLNGLCGIYDDSQSDLVYVEISNITPPTS
jgi:hypothetical protein